MRSKTNGRGFIRNRVDIEQRPAIVDEKLRFGDLEIDTVIGKNHKGPFSPLITGKPYHSWGRGVNENTNKQVIKVQRTLHNRLSKRLGYMTPLEKIKTIN